MSYNVSISNSASKEIQNLPKQEIPKIISKIEALAENPYPASCKKLVGTPEKLWRIRSGNYRIIYAVADSIKVVEIRRVSNRKESYK